MKTPILTIFIIAALCLGLTAATDIPGPIAEKGELLFSDDFERNDLGENWKTVVPTFTVGKGVLVGSQTRDDHGAVDGVFEFAHVAG
ncbi:MAG: hypothetical protein ACC661_05840, partial [Verrucomicrobiales bacterium]